MVFLQLLNLVGAGIALGLGVKALTLPLPLSWRLVMALPLLLPLSGALLFVLAPPRRDEGTDALWRFRATGIKLNPAHPTAKKLFWLWGAVGVVWLAVLAVALRHHFGASPGI